MSRYCLLLLLTPVVLAASAPRADGVSGASLQDCVNYEPDTVALTGTIFRRTFVNASDQKEVVWILRLAKPLCVNAGEDSDFNVKRPRVTDLQLVLEPNMFNKYRRLLGKRVQAKGTLFGEHTAHHFTPVLLDVTEIKLTT